VRSVVLASYQGDRFIEQQLRSILSQLAPEDEVIVSDDASTDRTLEVLRNCGDQRVRVIANSARVGYVANFERAIASARGEAIYFSDQDDVWLPEKVATMDVALRNSACVASDATVVDDSLRILHPSYFAWRGTRSFSPLAVFLKPPIVGATLACRRDYLDALRPLPPEIPHDFWLTLNAACDGELCVIDRPLILYRRHAHVASVSATGLRRSAATIAKERFAVGRAMLRRRIRAKSRFRDV